MTDDPFLTLVVEALNLMHPRFATADGRRSVVREFYHQFRHLWDRAVPVQFGLGHVLLHGEPDPAPDFAFWQIGERGEPDRPLGVVSVVPAADEPAIDAALVTLTRSRKQNGYPHAVCVVIGRTAGDPVPDLPGVSVVLFDTDRWQTV